MVKIRVPRLTPRETSLWLISLIIFWSFFVSNILTILMPNNTWEELYHNVFDVGAKPLVPLQTNRQLVQMKRLIANNLGNPISKINLDRIQALIDVAKLDQDKCLVAPYSNIELPLYQQVEDQQQLRLPRKEKRLRRRMSKIDKQKTISLEKTTNIDEYLVYFRKEQTLICLTLFTNDLKRAVKDISQDEAKRINRFKQAAFAAQNHYILNKDNASKLELCQTKFLHVSIIEACILTMKEVLDNNRHCSNLVRPSCSNNFVKEMQLQIGDLCDHVVNTLGLIVSSMVNFIHKDDYFEISELMDETTLEWISNVMVCRAYETEVSYYETKTYSDFKKRFPSQFSQFVNALNQIPAKGTKIIGKRLKKFANSIIGR